MISISKPYIIENECEAYLKARVDISDDTVRAFMHMPEKMRGIPWRFYENYPPAEWKSEDSGLWFSVDKVYRDGLCTERSDAFVVAMLWYALVCGSDISFEAPISESLYCGLKFRLFPMFAEKGIAKINLSGPVTGEKVNTAGAVGTGLSCGVDSLYTLKQYTDPDIPDSYRLTHLVYMDMGNIFHLRTIIPGADTLELPEYYRQAERIAQQKIKNAAEAADEAGLPLVVIRSNLDSDYYRGGYAGTAIYRNCAGILALSGLFEKYYLSSSGVFLDASLFSDSDDYVLMLCDSLSGNSLRFIVPDYVGRLQKTMAIADDEIAKKHLDVCFNFSNCGKCRKCIRTLLMLDAIGKLDGFSGVFDLTQYRKNRKKYIREYTEMALTGGFVSERQFFQEIHSMAGNFNPELAKEINDATNYVRIGLKSTFRKIKRCSKQLIRRSESNSSGK